MIANNEVHLFRTALDLPETTIRKLAGLLSEDENNRVARFRFPHLKTRFIAAHGVLRLILAHYTGLGPEKIIFRTNDRGKPEIANDSGAPDLFFNLSHSGDAAFYGLSQKPHIGVDIEHIRPLSNMESIAERYFSPKEFNTIKNLPENRQNPVFFRYWTLKEAYLKATGQGLTDLRQIEVGEISDDTDRTRILHTDMSGDAWSLYPLAVIPGYAAALAVKGEASVIPCRKWPL